MNEYLTKLLYTHETALPKYVCDDLIKMFEDNKELHAPGRAGGDIKLTYRKVTNFSIIT